MRTLIQMCTCRRGTGPSLPNGASLAGVRDADFAAFGLMLWGVSLWRVVLSFPQHGAFGTEATLALGCVCFIPWLLWRSSDAASNGDDSRVASGQLILLRVPSEMQHDPERSRRD
jgi:hypothetical protein